MATTYTDALSQKTIELPNLTTLVENIPSLTDDEYALIRRQGLGASDSSILLEVNPYKTKDQLIIEKRSKHITDEERAVKRKDAVRKGFDLEPLILQKYATLMERERPIKPEAMFQITETPYLTINYDGIDVNEDGVIPVEGVATRFSAALPQFSGIWPIHSMPLSFIGASGFRPLVTAS